MSIDLATNEAKYNDMEEAYENRKPQFEELSFSQYFSQYTNKGNKRLKEAVIVFYPKGN